MLCRATPRSWLQAGERIVINGASTSLGQVSFNITSSLSESAPSGSADVIIAPTLGTAAAQEVISKKRGLSLRLRVPQQWRMHSVNVNGQPWVHFDADSEVVTLPAPAL